MKGKIHTAVEDNNRAQGTGGDKDIDEIVQWEASPNAIRVMKLKDMMWVGHVACMIAVLIRNLVKNLGERDHYEVVYID